MSRPRSYVFSDVRDHFFVSNNVSPDRQPHASNLLELGYEYCATMPVSAVNKYQEKQLKLDLKSYLKKKYAPEKRTVGDFIILPFIINFLISLVVKYLISVLFSDPMAHIEMKACCKTSTSL